MLLRSGPMGILRKRKSVTTLVDTGSGGNVILKAVGHGMWLKVEREVMLEMTKSIGMVREKFQIYS